MTTTLMPSPTLKSAFSPYTDSPSSPTPYSVAFRARSMQRASTGSERDSLAPPPSPYPATVDPSPVESNDSHSTDVTDIDQDDLLSPSSGDDPPKSPDIEIMSPMSNRSAEEAVPLPLVQIDTNVSKVSDDGPSSVIHAPAGFRQFRLSIHKFRRHGQELARHHAHLHYKRQKKSGGDGQDIEEADDLDRPDSPHISNTSSGRPETITDALQNLSSAEAGVSSLKRALKQCWTLCNTLANLSSIHRERMFSFSGSGDVQELAWKSCWRLCQNLYESREETAGTHVGPTLELCREFCQALFEARHRGDEVTDSILRVSFELNNHLYNTHDRNLPNAFRERTLDFYLTMCHRLMKQRTALPEETDALLRACWQLAEVLFSLRQNSRDGKPVDEELLASAVQACWELCDLFREGWTQIRPDRGTPKPVQRVSPGQSYQESYTSNQNNYQQNNQTPSRPSSSLSGTFHSVKSQMMPPETPTTIFDDQDEASPTESNIAVPNILVLGPDPKAMTSMTARGMTTHNRWSSSSSLSNYSDASQRTTTSVNRASTATPTPMQASQNPQQQNQQQQQQQQQVDPEDTHQFRLQALILKSAVNLGFGRQSPATLTAFVKTLPSTAFGQQPWQIKLFESYRKLVLSDPTLRGDLRQFLPAGRRMTASEIARAVQWISLRQGFDWFRDLFRLVFGFDADEGDKKKGVAFQI
ncbi:hypothetical protein E2P81_ATG01194 [Venturia nashicola]|uniref:DUF7624 domain-containing protein n=1 Tax=Venturia nashicola TaxID=86259 RepID=A0A4Z1PBG5_9PEZI|nr:hypothetical protein E6O75_ATG01221 [Venturia nashicola]TLD38651.1 hypothetical protein E2P81_ATG01194 [Venturia nashicola]